MKSLFEFLNEKSYKVYHGTNINFDKFTLDNSKSSEYKVGWFVDDYGYASTQGKFVKEFTLKPKKVLDVNSAKKITDDEIIDAIMKYKPSLLIYRIEKALPKIRKRITDYIKGNISGMDIFNGFGGTKILLNLGFDMEVFKNPYDKSGESDFYAVFNDEIIK